MKRRKRRRKKKDKVKKVGSCTLSKAREPHLAGTELITTMHVNQKVTNISDHNS